MIEDEYVATAARLCRVTRRDWKRPGWLVDEMHALATPSEQR